MNKQEFRKALEYLEISQLEAARRLGVDGSTVRRYLSGASLIPGPIEAAVRCWVKLKETEG